ncbi:MAG: hypothetical protein Ct9H90mP20_7300 [Candidatus Neomarinimicrobiota bacterium]|nr:MAG: hypothetical protein Ct9H90mP20_7300 [Candidatus Neomarinimicrobiota bacterium]
MWAFGDAALGFMTFPNLISIIMLSGVLKKKTNEYFSMEQKFIKNRSIERVGFYSKPHSL